ncbi:hypothetical protein E2C01_041981 [Portunus trituberculatus]|uniref:Uncharacterized protein n=1 Tax=Portunus trituberculatus TaxID=210409 RepID=A0A5B7FT50_PORTR|nr:hypothetical protein [Portunus trituberculatus]
MQQHCAKDSSAELRRRPWVRPPHSARPSRPAPPPPPYVLTLWQGPFPSRSLSPHTSTNQRILLPHWYKLRLGEYPSASDKSGHMCVRRPSCWEVPAGYQSRKALVLDRSEPLRRVRDLLAAPLLAQCIYRPRERCPEDGRADR